MKPGRAITSALREQAWKDHMLLLYESQSFWGAMQDRFDSEYVPIPWVS